MQVTGDARGSRVDRLPAATEYAVALADPTRAFERPDLQNATFFPGPFGVRVQMGEHTVVARATLAGRQVAIRCHLQDDPDQEARYRTVEEHLQRLGANV